MQFACPGCGQTYEVTPEQVGQRVGCVKCSAQLLVEATGFRVEKAPAPPPLAYFAPPKTLNAGPENEGLKWILPVGRSGWAIAAGYLGLFSVLVCPGPIAVIISIIAILDIRKHPGRLGKGRAIFGLVMGILGTLGLLLWLIFAVLR